MDKSLLEVIKANNNENYTWLLNGEPAMLDENGILAVAQGEKVDLNEVKDEDWDFNDPCTIYISDDFVVEYTIELVEYKKIHA